MANLPEKNITQVDEITSVPANSKLFVNANGEFRQATVNEVVKSSTVVTSAVENAINTAVEDGVNSHFKQTTGSPILLTDSAEGVLADFKAYGRSTQKQYSGKNLLENTATTTSLNGGTFTVNEDGSVNVKGAFTDVTEFSIGIYNATENSILSGCPSGGSENTYQLRSSGIGADYGGGLGITAGSNTSIYIRVMSGQTIDITFYPMIRQASVTDSTYEPYTNGVAPNPNYPQAIKSVADSGYFDGELLGGYYNASGVFIAGANTTNVGNINPIPCNGGDVVKIIYEESISAITTSFYDENMVFIERQYKLNTNEFVITAPSNAKYMNFHLSAEYIITPQTSKHITVTINGKYALIVKSKGKNLFDISKIPNTANMTNNQNGTLTITNSYSNNTYKKLSELTDLKIGQTYTLSFSSTSEHQFIYLSTTSEKWENGMSLKMTQNRLDSAVYFYGNTSGVTTISNIQIEENTVVTPYEPYKETVSYIPLNEPLRGVGSVTDVASLSEVTRRFAEVVLDGSDDEVIIAFGNDYPHLFRISVNGVKETRVNVICTHFLSHRKANSDYSKNMIYTFNDHILINHMDITTVAEFKTWLQANPITVVYELAEPITETIEPIDIVTYDNVTYLTASDNAEMELEYPTSKVAGIASIGYSKGRKAEYEVELLKAQLLELQTAMVNSL